MEIDELKKPLIIRGLELAIKEAADKLALAATSSNFTNYGVVDLQAVRINRMLRLLDELGVHWEPEEQYKQQSHE